MTGDLASTLGTLQPFRYRGYVYDEETGLYYLQSRYYDPEVGRFISSDLLLSTGQGVMGHNAYAYCLGNPVGMRDDGGTRPVKDAIDSDEDGESYPDRTFEMIQLLIQNVETAEKWAWDFGLCEFIDHVNVNGDWDYKLKPPEWMPANNKFSFAGINMTAADLGNLNYGFTGAAMGFTRETLLAAGGFIAIYKNGDSGGIEYYFDAEIDYYYINVGIDAYAMRHPLYGLYSDLVDSLCNTHILFRIGLVAYKGIKDMINYLS